jgi:hypothetical protein
MTTHKRSPAGQILDDLRERRRGLERALRGLTRLSTGKRPGNLPAALPEAVKREIGRSEGHLAKAETIFASFQTMTFFPETVCYKSESPDALGTAQETGVLTYPGLSYAASRRLMEELAEFVDQAVGFYKKVQSILGPAGQGVGEEQLDRLEAIRKPLKAAKPPRRAVRLDIPAGTTWDMVIFRLLSDDTVYIVVDGKPLGAKNFAELGFWDARKGKVHPNLLWALLRLFAIHNGEITPKTQDAQEMLSHKKRISDLGKALRSIFGIDDNPFYPYRKTHTYRAKFSVLEPVQENSEQSPDEPECDLFDQGEEIRRKLGNAWKKGGRGHKPD